jgi:hypothetical protein
MIRPLEGNAPSLPIFFFFKKWEATERFPPSGHEGRTP